MKANKKQKPVKNKKPLSEAQLRQRREAASRPRTRSPEAQAQSRAAAALSTGPRTEAGKAASSRNAYVTGEYSAIAKTEMWKQAGIGMLFKPCKTTCPKHPSNNPEAPCSLVEDGTTRAGQDCLDKQIYVEVFNGIINTLESGDVAHLHGMQAHELAMYVQMSHDVREKIRTDGLLYKKLFIDKKTGQPIPDPSNDGEYLGELREHPLLVHWYKMAEKMGINFPELLATPKAAAAAKSDKETVDAAQELVERATRAVVVLGGGPVKYQTYDVVPEEVEDRGDG